jgi:hypothetical protein
MPSEKFKVIWKKTTQNGRSKNCFPILHNGILKNPFWKIHKKYSSAKKKKLLRLMMMFVGIPVIRR